MSVELESIAPGGALPSQWYADPAIFDLETTTVLRRSWHYVAHRGQLAAVGDQLPIMLAGVPIVLVRAGDGSVRGFVNICRHRAHLVVLEPRNRKALFCSYHGWSYDLEGDLRHAPRAESEPGFDTSECSLVPILVAQWGPTIWVNVDVDAPSFDAWVGGLPQVIAEHGIDIDQHVFAFGASWEIAANWKVFSDNAIECYHCPTAHPELSRVLEMDPDLQETSIGGRYWSTHRMPFRSSVRPADRGDDGSGEPLQYYFHWIFPTTYLQYAGVGFDVGSIQVVGVDRIVFHHQTFFPTDADEAMVAERRERLAADPTIPQDVAICERVQVAHASGAARPGRLLPRSEQLLQHFQRVLVELVQRR
jgi:choline monooxygenase